MIIEWTSGAAYQARRYIVGAFALTWTATPQAGAAVAHENLTPRWLVILTMVDSVVLLSDAPGELQGAAYADGLVGVQISPLELNLESCTVSRLAVTVVLSPGLRDEFFPIAKLNRCQVAVRYFDGETVRSWMEYGVIDGDATELGDIGDPITIHAVEGFAANRRWPPIIEVPAHFSEETVAEGAKGTAYTQVYGDARAVPARLIQLRDGKNLYMLCGHGLRPGDPCPQIGFPKSAWPEVGGTLPNSVVGLHYGLTQLFRDPFEASALKDPGAWKVISGTWTEAGGVLETTTTGNSIRKFKAWKLEGGLSIRFKAKSLESPQAGTIWAFWNFVDSDNHQRVQWEFGTPNRITYISREAGVDVVSEPHDLTLDGTGVKRYTLDVKEGSAEAGYETERVSFGKIASAPTGFFALGSAGGKIQWTRLTGPSARSDASNSDTNDQIQYFRNDVNLPMVCEAYRDGLAEDLSATFYQAQNISSAGDMVADLIMRWSRIGPTLRDDGSLEQLRAALSQVPIGSFFDDPQPIMDIIEQRLQPELWFALYQEAGLLRAAIVDPYGPTAAVLVRPNELLELRSHALARPFTRFTAEWAFFPPADKFLATESWRLASIEEEENSIGGANRRDFPSRPCPDFQTIEGVRRWLAFAASLLAGGERPAYLMESRFSRLPLGAICALTDEDRGYANRRAMLIARQPESPRHLVHTFHVFTPFQESTNVERNPIN